MISENSRLIQSPDRKEITLCEAVTAFIYGKAYDLRQLDQVRSDTAPIEEHVGKLNDLLHRLHTAAYAGRIKFSAIKEKADPADGFENIDPRYFYVKPVFNWQEDVVFHREDETSTPWSFVHLDREQFASLLGDMDLEPRQHEPADAGAGLPGHPPSIHLIEPEAARRLAAEQHPETITAFGVELAEWFKATFPLKAPVRPRSVGNRFRKAFNAHKKRSALNKFVRRFCASEVTLCAPHVAGDHRHFEGEAEREYEFSSDTPAPARRRSASGVAPSSTRRQTIGAMRLLSATACATSLSATSDATASGESTKTTVSARPISASMRFHQSSKA